MCTRGSAVHGPQGRGPRSVDRSMARSAVHMGALSMGRYFPPQKSQNPDFAFPKGRLHRRKGQVFSSSKKSKPWFWIPRRETTQTERAGIFHLKKVTRSGQEPESNHSPKQVNQWNPTSEPHLIKPIQTTSNQTNAIWNNLNQTNSNQTQNPIDSNQHRMSLDRPEPNWINSNHINSNQMQQNHHKSNKLASNQLT